MKSEKTNLPPFEIQSDMISFNGASCKVDAYLSRPLQEGQKLPAVIVIHEIFGLDEHIKDVTRRFASQGYVALAPHLFSRPELKEILTSENVLTTLTFMQTLPPGRARDRDFVQEQLAKMPDDNKKNTIARTLTLILGGMPKESLVEDLVRGVAFLNGHDYVKEGKVASVGFCFGGGLSAALACRGKTAACVIFYGENPEPIDQVQNIAGPVLGIYGSEDERITSNVDKLVKAMASYKKDFEMRIYPGCAHAFFNDTRKQVYREAAARDAWERVLRFCSRTISAQ